ncbi:hypothetical protein [Tenacibaculum finnmarkense]|uniref:DUF4198 domain-containing protein n=1 Tax=Tenacibaculum finnmarkense genomovar ulcerans TaxID=2781388 RepID=A0A2I2MAE9_9FLAO|nr:hypothetical protein [Tenacibaculum finnmarkense]MBE7644876.1 hypothetical protein [Tenacibaculum finnmarkense genomovar ulcerans]MBE7696374.1 hypothetical protein [Tenacibaculum finnmarkense genomovar ulcerans]MCD8431558.1 hypothetical protein [Tenacibaculum finnmarkense genomovar ulcerans]MCG8794855.1 hypothetical protein [Tenacibaculum finnmarkense]MCG8797182.1 hypothetical protein [Tenacibaculum finnmarkense]
MKKINFLLILIILPIFMSHSVWMQIKNKGKVGDKAKVNLYFGEIRENVIEKGLKWYDGEIFKEFKGYVKLPNSDKKEALVLTPSEVSVSGTFTPKTPGIYQIVAFNETGSIKDYTKHGLGLLKDAAYLRTTFEATSWRVKQEGMPNLKPMMKYDIVPFPAKNGYGSYNSHKATWRVKEKVYARFYIDGEIATDKEIKVYSPDGWTSIKKTDKNGMFYFIPYKKGTYQAIYQLKKQENGVYKGQKYNTTRIKVISNLNIE